MAESIEGDGLTLLHRALDPLADNPELLERIRSRRWSHSPPANKYFLSGTTTASEASEQMTEEERLRDERKFHLIGERSASYPSQQFDKQVLDEARRIQREIYEIHGYSLPADEPILLFSRDTTKRARENVKKCWVEQGIWNEKWK